MNQQYDPFGRPTSGAVPPNNGQSPYNNYNNPGGYPPPGTGYRPPYGTYGGAGTNDCRQNRNAHG